MGCPSSNMQREPISEDSLSQTPRIHTHTHTHSRCTCKNSGAPALTFPEETGVRGSSWGAANDGAFSEIKKFSAVYTLSLSKGTALMVCHRGRRKKSRFQESRFSNKHSLSSTMGRYVLLYGLMVLWGDQHSVFISGEFGKQHPTLPT